MIKKHVLFLCLLLLPLTANADIGEFPISCEISSSENRHKAKFEEYALGELSSVLDSCAFGERLNNMVSGALSGLFKKLDSLNFNDVNFFCGFGTQDIWRIGTKGTSAEGTRNFNQWRRKMVNQTQKEIGIYNRGWSRGSGRYDAVPDNLFEEIFQPKERN